MRFDLLRVAFPYFGSKGWLYPLLNIPQHEVYVEPFGGGLAIFWRKSLAKLNVINDLNPWVYNAWIVIKEWGKLKGEVLRLPWWKLKKTNKSGLEWELLNLQKEADGYTIKDIPDLRAFYLFMVRQYWGYGGYAWYPVKGKKHFGFEEELKKFDILSVKLNHPSVVIRNDDFRDVLKDYKDCKEAWIYMDPPYTTMLKDDAYDVQAKGRRSDVWPEDVAGAIRDVAGKWAVSYDKKGRVVRAFLSIPKVWVYVVRAKYQLLVKKAGKNF